MVYDQSNISVDTVESVCDVHALVTSIIDKSVSSLFDIELKNGEIVGYILTPMALTVLMSASQSSIETKHNMTNNKIDGKPFQVLNGDNEYIRVIIILESGDIKTVQINLTNVSFL